MVGVEYLVRGTARLPNRAADRTVRIWTTVHNANEAGFVRAIKQPLSGDLWTGEFR